ncbi:uncharacterized protein LOC127082404 [Lathyrus oleraceus]|uniref:uncharacterized protein LOC127082404 n=1 Tax=Pisum sativum TaxID=3888 RepID=UPI0021CE4834|nr:uncharacterized protein LOC127082404 [Pisum sativum]
MDDFIATQTLSRLEYMIERFVATQTLQNEEFRKQNLHTNEILRQVNIVGQSLAIHNKSLKIQISLLAHTPLGSFPGKHADSVTINSEKIKNSKENDNEEISCEKRVEIEKNILTPPEREVVEEVEKKASYVVPPLYNPRIPFTQRFVEAKVDSKSKRHVEVLENIHANAPLFEVLRKKRKLKDHETK